MTATIRTAVIGDEELLAKLNGSFNEETHEVFSRLGFVPKTVRFELPYLRSNRQEK
jgi:hypothetical protein